MYISIATLFQYSFKQVILGGGIYIVHFLTILCAYLLLRLVFLFFKDIKSFIELVFSVLILFTLLFTITFITGYVISYLTVLPSEGDVIIASLMLMDWDLSVFKVYPIFWIHDTQNIFYGVINSAHYYFQYVYSYLGMAILCILFITIYKRPDFFYRFNVALLMTIILAVPIWLLVPAVSPQELLFDGKFIFDVPPDIHNYMSNYSPSSEMVTQMAYFKEMWKSNTNGYFAITSFPSMHVGWATVLLYYSIRFSKYLTIPVSIFYLLTCVSTVYLLQHYAVDIFMGAFVGVVAIIISEKYLKKVPRQILLINSYLQKDVSNLKNLSENISERITKRLYSR